MRPAVAAALLFLAGGSFACFDTRSSDCSGNGDLVVFSGTKVYDDVPDDVVTQMCKCDEEYKGTDCSIYSAGIRGGHCSTDDNGDACTNGGVAEGYMTIASEDIDGYGLGCPLYNIFAHANQPPQLHPHQQHHLPQAPPKPQVQCVWLAPLGGSAKMAALQMG